MEKAVSLKDKSLYVSAIWKNLCVYTLTELNVILNTQLIVWFLYPLHYHIPRALRSLHYTPD